MNDPLFVKATQTEVGQFLQEGSTYHLIERLGSLLILARAHLVLLVLRPGGPFMNGTLYLSLYWLAWLFIFYTKIFQPKVSSTILLFLFFLCRCIFFFFYTREEREKRFHPTREVEK